MGYFRFSTIQIIWKFVLFVVLFLTSFAEDHKYQGLKLVLAGGEKAYFTVPQMTPGVSYRQNVCDRYEQFSNGTIELKDALNGMSLNLLMSAYTDGYFNYDPETGINPDNPGLTAVLMDELARRGGFTWRDSFGISVAPYDNHTWTDLLVWGTEVYDMNIDWWAQNVERMNMGVAFLEEWYDSSIILIRRKPVEVISNEIRFWNWLRPYEDRVWILTIFTIILSGLVYQWLEHLSGQRANRTMWQWFQENWYLSMLSFTQTYEYTPTTFEGRLFGVSMAIWALVMTATYTANLASLLVDKTVPQVIVSSIEEAVIAGAPICTFEGTNSDTFIKNNMPTAVRVEKKTLEEVYRGLYVGECLLAAEVVASWEELKGVRKFNPTCDLERVPTTVWSNKAGFAAKSDSGRLCSGLIRDVINLHMSELIADGFLEDAWERQHKLSLDIDCDAYRPDLDVGLSTEAPSTSPIASDGTRHLRESTTRQLVGGNAKDLQRYRRLKAGRGATGGAVAAAAAAGSSGDDNADELTLEQMIGTFAFHWFLMTIAIAIAHFKAYYGMYGKKHLKSIKQSLSQRFTTVRTKSSLFNTGSSTRTGIQTIANNADESKPSSYAQSEDNICPSSKESSAVRFTKDGGSFIDNNDDTGSNLDVHGQLRLMHDSQVRMQKQQHEMLQEQKLLKEQIHFLVSLVQKQNENNQQVNTHHTDDEDEIHYCS